MQQSRTKWVSVTLLFIFIFFFIDEWGAAEAQEEEQLPINRKVGGLTSPGPHVDASLGRTPNPTLPTNASIGVWMCVNVVGSTV